MAMCATCRFWIRPDPSPRYANYSTDQGECGKSAEMTAGPTRRSIRIDTTDLVLPRVYTGEEWCCPLHEAKSETTE
jgi:hypothetical protein